MLRSAGTRLALFVIAKLSRAVAVVLLATIAIAVLMSFSSGSVADAMLGADATPEKVAELNHELGTDRPLWEQYVSWLLGALRGDLGSSLVSQHSVLDEILSRIPVTAELAILAVLMALVFAVIGALISATWPGSWIDRILSGWASITISIPAFIAGPVLIFVFAVELGWFPALGWRPLTAGLDVNLRSAFLPALSISLMEFANFYRLLRSDLVTTLGEDFIGAARARGLSGGYVMLRHALRPSSFSLITVIGISLGGLMAGTVVVEVLFVVPGIGQLLVTAVSGRDVIMVQGIVAFTAIVYVVMNMVVDVGYTLLDPRVRRAVR
ncbi:MAG: ABC transporter permease [Microbacterium sp.]|uniref:ABC transporter permease n=1 Tax=Microbacterium sp. TaxID=51671 RepID=UPI0039E712B1